ncbi:DMT family transporter [Thiofilum flexile]|uniref:DMT family transporter n=1 Tax=Thiofilum flexile TaxID=125627 RepID=UPI00037908AD|nr:SMR family transporter [Thiofilum flexile]
MSYVYLALAIVAEVIATSSLKATEEFTKPLPTIIMVLGYLLAFYLMTLTLRTMSIGIVYAIWSSLGIVLISLVGVFLYNEKLDTPALIGIGFIITGVVIMQLFSKSVHH